MHKASLWTGENMISWVAMDRIVERQRAVDAAYRKHAAGKVLRSDAKLLTDGDLLSVLDHPDGGAQAGCITGSVGDSAVCADNAILKQQASAVCTEWLTAAKLILHG